MLSGRLNQFLLFALVLSVLFSWTFISDYEVERAYKFLDAALIMGVFLLGSKSLYLNPMRVLVIVFGLVLVIIPMSYSGLEHDARMHAVSLFFLLLSWVFWSVALKDDQCRAYVKWAVYTGLLMLCVWALIGLVPLLFDGAISHAETYTVMAGVGHRNLLVQVLMVFLPFVFVFSIDHKVGQVLRKLLLLLVVGIVLLLLNRTGWIALFLFGVFGLYHLLKYTGAPRSVYLKRSWLLLLPIGLLLLFVDELYTLWHHVEMTFTFSDGTTRDRLLLLQRTFDMFWDKPLFGEGFGMWKVHALGYDQTGMLTESARMFYKRPHNDYAWLFSEGGLLVGLPYLLLHVAALRKSWLEYVSVPSIGSWGVVMVWVLIMFTSATNYAFEQPLFMLLQGLGLSIVFPLTQREEGRYSQYAWKWASRLVIVSLCVLTVLISYDRSRAGLAYERSMDWFDQGELGQAQAMFTQAERGMDLDPMLRPMDYQAVRFDTSLVADTVIQRMKLALKVTPDHPHIHHAIGLAHKKKGEDKLAMLSFQRAVELTPSYADAWLGIGSLRYSAGQWREAFDAILKADPSVVDEAYSILGTRLAADSLKAMIKTCPDRKMKLTLAAIRNTPYWALDILRKAAKNDVGFAFQAYVDACYYMLSHCDEYQDCDLAETMTNTYLPNGMDDLNFEANELSP